MAIWLALTVFLIAYPLAKLILWLLKNIQATVVRFFSRIGGKIAKVKKRKETIKKLLQERQKAQQDKVEAEDKSKIEAEIKTETTAKTETSPQKQPKAQKKSQEISPTQKQEQSKKQPKKIPSPSQFLKAHKDQRLKNKLHQIKIEALALKERKKFDDYEKKLIEWLALDPENLEFLEMLGDYYFFNRQYKKAFSIFKKIIKHKKDDHKTIWKMAKIYFEIWEPQNAQLLIQKAIQKDPDNIKYLTTAADIEYALGNYSEAIKILKKIIKLRPSSTKYLIAIANIFEEMWETERAKVFIQKAYLIDSEDPLVKQKITQYGLKV